MIIPSEGGGGNASQGVTVSLLTNLKEKVTGFKLTQKEWILLIAASVVMIVFRKLNIKTKKLNFKIGGKK